MQQVDLQTWLRNWICTAPEEDVRGKFLEVLPYLTDEDIAYIFYQAVIQDHPVEAVDALIE